MQREVEPGETEIWECGMWVRYEEVESCGIFSECDSEQLNLLEQLNQSEITEY